MITRYAYQNLGQADHGWLKARHHFSFANYYNPARIGFGKLLVINDDRIASGKGFGTHPHQNMEIITYVRQGAITHKDSLGNTGRTEAGEVQVMSAGRGVAHSEYNLENEETSLYQIWIEPNLQNVEPSWEKQYFPTQSHSGEGLKILVSGRNGDQADTVLKIHQDAAIWGGTLAAGQTVLTPIKHQAYVLVSKGSAMLNGTKLEAGDGAEAKDEQNLKIEALTEAELLIIDVPA